MNEDFGLLVDFLRGELDSGSAATVRRRLEDDGDYFALFQRLKRTYDVLRSLPNVRPAVVPYVAADVPQIDPREEFVAAVRREFEARDWMSLLPWIEGREEFLRGLRVEFSVRALMAAIPQLDPARSFIESLRHEFAARAALCSIPHIKARPEWVRAVRNEFSVRALVASIPAIDPRPEFVAATRALFAPAALPQLEVREGFKRRLQVALFEAAREVAPVETAAAKSALPDVPASDSFRRRLFKKVLFTSRRKVREEPKRTDVEGYQWGRELERGFKNSRRSLAFTMGLHALAIGVMLFIFAGNPTGEVSPSLVIGQNGVQVTPELPRHGDDEIPLPGYRPEKEGVGATGEDWSSASEPPPVGIGEDSPSPEPDIEQAPQDEPRPQRSAGETSSVLPGAARDGTSSFFRLRTQSRAQKVAYLGREDLANALDKMLAYLARTQQSNTDGYWWHDGVDTRIVPGNDDLKRVQQIELTSIALLAFLGDGHSSEESPVGYNWNVKRGIDWLIRQQNADGQIGPKGYDNVLIHAMATLALAEDFGLTRSPRLREPLRQACRWLCAVKADGSDGFPFKANGKASLTTSVWAYMALATARNVKVPPIDLPAQRINAFEDWYASVTGATMVLDDQRDLFVDKLVPMSAAAALSLFAPQADHAQRADSLVRQVSRVNPDLKGKGEVADMRYLFFGSLAIALKQQGGSRIAGEWQNRFAETLLQNQLANGAYEPSGDYARLYGRVYDSALAALSIENAYRINLMAEQK